MTDDHDDHNDNDHDNDDDNDNDNNDNNDREAERVLGAKICFQKGPLKPRKNFKFQGTQTEVVSVLKNARFIGVSARSSIGSSFSAGQRALNLNPP